MIAFLLVICLALSAPTCALAIPSNYIAGAETVETLQETITVLEERQRFAHEFAELARYFGFFTPIDPIAEAQTIWYDSKLAIEDCRRQIEESACIDLHYSPTKRVGLSVEAFDRMLAGSSLAGQGQAFYDLEQTHNVNGVFAIGVANTESTIGRNCYGFNPYGMLTTRGTLIKYDSWYSSTMAFGELMNRSLYNGKSIEAIAKIYCPPNHKNWTRDTLSTMRQMYSKLEN